MPDVTIRDADVFDVPLLAHELKTKFPAWEQIDFHQAHTIIAEYQGKPFASSSVRLVLQIEPLMIFDDSVPQNAKRRGMHQLFKAMEAWIADPAQNKTGILSYVCHLSAETVAKWAERMGMKIFSFFGSKTLTSPQ